jgi:hypothetical protein
MLSWEQALMTSFVLLCDARKFFFEFAHRDKRLGLLVKVTFSLALKFLKRFRKRSLT